MRRATTNQESIPRVELVEEVTARLRKEILAGRFGPDGELPVEAELTLNYGVSRTVTREALRTLRSQGLIEVRQGRRPRVKPVNSEAASESLDLLIRRGGGSITNITEVRRPLEAEIAALAAERWRDTMAIAHLEAAIEQLVGARTLNAQIEADTLFHGLLADLTGNLMFTLLLATIAPLLTESRKKTLGHVGAGRAIEGHRAILEAVERRDPAAARAAMLRHMDMAGEDLLRGEK